MSRKQKRSLIKIIISSILVIFAIFLPIKAELKFVLHMAAYLVVGADIIKKAVKGIINLKPFDENFLMAVATVGAIILGEYLESVAVMLFFQIGELFQSYAVGKSRRNIAELMDIRPDYANVIKGGNVEVVSPYEVSVGETILVKPGEKVPLDGIIIEGKTTFDTACLTGESMPRDAVSGEEILAGFINLSGVIKVRTTKNFGESTASKILELVENASFRKSRSENFIKKFAKVYTPFVCISALVLAIIPPVIRLFMGLGGEFSVWVYRALTFLVVSCPCALVISIPLGFFAGLGGASKEGILIKGSNFLEALSKVRHVVFDKTGTVTKGVFEVVKVNPVAVSEDKLLEYACLVEIYSNHPVSDSIKRAFKGEIDKARISDTEEISGHGIRAIIDGSEVLAGNEKLMESLGIAFEKSLDLGTIIYVAKDTRFIGSIVLADTIKSTAPGAIKKLKRMSIKSTTMLTGDRKTVADKISDEIGTDKVYSELLPDEKVLILEEILGRKEKNEAVCFVGDGINDAPSITRADVGIAMGGIGADSAIEAADVVLMDDNPEKIPKAIAISKKCMRIVYQNIYFAIGVKGLCLILGALGLANMWIAIFADVGVMVLAVLNAIRTLNTKNL